VPEPPPPQCPDCGSAVAVVGSEPPWCPACTWNLERRSAAEDRRSRRIRRERRRAIDLDRRLFDRLTADTPAEPRGSAATLLTVVSVMLLVVDLALLGVGAWCCSTGSVRITIVGVVALLLALELRPRVPRVDVRSTTLEADDVPELVEVVSRAAEALGAPRIDRLAVDDDFNALLRP
jgi:heat shock protein HtpX